MTWLVYGDESPLLIAVVCIYVHMYQARWTPLLSY